MTDVTAAIRWWAALTALGLAALPLVYTLLRRLPDRGYAFLRPAGLLLAAWVYWLAGSLGFSGNNGGGILLALAVVAGLSWLAYRRRPAGDPPLGGWLRANLTTVVATELVFAAVFILWAFVRAQNPAISATEKPMEFAFLNGVGRSPVFPPLDPWLSGYAISYYYFGYVMTSLLARLAFVAEPVAFNLAIAWIVAGTATGAFGIVVNLISLRQNTRYEIRDTNGERSELVSHISSLVSRTALLWGLVAALAVPIAGNLQIGLELLHGNGIGPAALWAWLDVRDINGPAVTADPARYETTSWWWWRTSRVIHEYYLDGRAEEGLEPIVEVPAFSFILGDLHPHVLALPFAFLAMAVALMWWLEIKDSRLEVKDSRLEVKDSRLEVKDSRLEVKDSRLEIKDSRPEIRHSRPEFADTNDELPVADGEFQEGPAGGSGLMARISRHISRRTAVPLPLWLFTAVVLGGLSFLNTWDVGIYLFLVLGAYFLAHWFRQGHARGLLGRTALLAVLLVVPAVLLYLPFYLGFRSQAGPPFLLPMLMRPTRLAHYLIIFGMPLLVITIFLLALAGRRRFRHWRAGLAAAGALVGGLLLLMLVFTWIVAAGPDGGRIGNMALELGLALPPRPVTAIAPGWAVSAVLALLPALLGARLSGPWLTLLLAGLVALVVMVLRSSVEEEIGEAERTGQPPGRPPSAVPFVLLLILTGVLLTLGPEFVYLRDNFGVRLNTTFKFYYQAWAMFGVAAVFALDYLWATRRTTADRLAAYAASGAYLLLLAVALLFPILAVGSRAAEYRGPAEAADGAPLERQPATLDGLAYLNRYNPSEYEALMWLRQVAAATDGPPPVVLEAVGGQYSGYGRVSANTGLPTVLGWPGHEWQWRGSDHPEPGRREPIVEQIYKTPDLGVVGFLLDQFDVSYIYVGDLEREKYGPAGLEKFADQLEVAFANDRVTIYRWQPAAQ